MSDTKKVLVTGSGITSFDGSAVTVCKEGEEYIFPSHVADQIIKGGRGELVLNKKPAPKKPATK